MRGKFDCSLLVQIPPKSPPGFFFHRAEVVPAPCTLSSMMFWPEPPPVLRITIEFTALHPPKCMHPLGSQSALKLKISFHCPGSTKIVFLVISRKCNSKTTANQYGELFPYRAKKVNLNNRTEQLRGACPPPGSYDGLSATVRELLRWEPALRPRIVVRRPVCPGPLACPRHSTFCDFEVSRS